MFNPFYFLTHRSSSNSATTIMENIYLKQVIKFTTKLISQLIAVVYGAEIHQTVYLQSIVAYWSWNKFQKQLNTLVSYVTNSL